MPSRYLRSWRARQSSRPAPATPTARAGAVAGDTLGRVRLPVMPPVRPMLAKAVYEVPRAPGLLFEPKWDGFRCVVFRDGDEVELGSRNDRPLTRYFPEMPPALRAVLPERCVVDGEIVVVTGDGLDFDALQQRIHPAASRIDRLAAETPASFVAFDLIALGDRDLSDVPFAERRRLLEEVVPSGRSQVHVTPLTDDADLAEDWFTRFEGAGFDGVVAKPGDAPYRQDQRAMWKVKHQRTADCVVAGFRWHKDGEGIGSLLLGLYDGGVLHNVGVATSFAAARRRELVEEIAPLRGIALGRPPVGRVGRRRGPRPGGRAADAGRAQPLERHQGPVLGAAPPRAGDRGPLREPAGRALPPRVPDGALARRQAAGAVHLRAAGRRRPRRAPPVVRRCLLDGFV